MGTRVFMNIKFHERDSCPIMNIKLYIIVLLFIITLPAHICNAQVVYCNNTVNFTQGSAFQLSRYTVFNSLARDASQTGFNTSVSGKSPNIYGLLQCRGDTTAEQCQNCSVNATANIQASESCGNAVGGRIWSDLCYLYYDNHNFFGQLDTYGSVEVHSNNVSNPDAFNAALRDLFSNLSTEAVSTSKFYASGTTADSFSPKIYALAQCTRDISAEICTACLSQTTTSIFKYYYGRRGVQGLYASCIVVYETDSFFNSTVLPLPPSEALDNRPVVTPSSNSTNSIKKPIILGFVVGGLLALLVCLFTPRRRLKSVIFRSRDEGIAYDYMTWFSCFNF